MDRREIERLLNAIRDSRASGLPVAVASIVRVRGSAYRREGTRMLVRQDGTYECALSGGCLEPSVADAAVEVFRTGREVLVNYDLADDSVWGLGMGCSGAIDVLIEPLDGNEMMDQWLDVLDRGERAVLLTPLRGATGRVLVRAGGRSTGQLSDPIIEQEAVGRAQELMESAFPRSTPEAVGAGEIFFELSTPAPDLVIFGAGPDAAPLAREAWTLGFSVSVVDVRAAFLTRDRFPFARLFPAHFSEFASTVSVPAGGLVIVMNHNVERDEESLRFALDSDAAYIGVLGPRPRFELLLGNLAAKGYVPAADRLSRVHSPVGLSIGAETPEEVALSILGEILAIRRGFAGGFLTGSSTSLHRPEETRFVTRS